MTSVLVNKQAVEPVQVRPNRYGLLVAATQLTDADRWQAGVRWLPEQNNGGDIVALTCRGGTAALDLDTNRGVVESDPFDVYAEAHCSISSVNAGYDFEGRARRQLEATQSFLVAKELWEGNLAQSAPLDNHWLMEDPDVLGAPLLTSAVALGMLDQGLGEMLGGARGMIHVSVSMLDILKAANAVELSGQVWTTPMGTVVVADAGYPGSAPDGDASTKQWLYGTAWVSYHLSPIDVQVGNDLAVNTRQVWAQRLVLLRWDSEIPAGAKEGVLAIETDIDAYPGL